MATESFSIVRFVVSSMEILLFSFIFYFYFIFLTRDNT